MVKKFKIQPQFTGHGLSYQQGYPQQPPQQPQMVGAPSYVQPSNSGPMPGQGYGQHMVYQMIPTPQFAQPRAPGAQYRSRHPNQQNTRHPSHSPVRHTRPRMPGNAGNRAATALYRKRPHNNSSSFDADPSPSNSSASKKQYMKPKTDKSANAKPTGPAQKPKPKDASFGAAGKQVLELTTVIPTVTFADFGGCEEQLLEACRLSIHLKHPEIYEALRVHPPKGFLVHGPPGSGKTMFAEVLAGELGIDLLKVSATELIAGISGETENKIRTVFRTAAAKAPCILLIDEIDTIAGKRESAQRDMERRVVTQLLASLDELNKFDFPEEEPVQELVPADSDAEMAAVDAPQDDDVVVVAQPSAASSSSESKPQKDETEAKGEGQEDEDEVEYVGELPPRSRYVLVIGTSNRPDNLDAAIRRAGRFDHEIGLGIPDEKARHAILSIVCRNMKLDAGLTMKELARLTPGYVGADLQALVREASMAAVHRVFTNVLQDVEGEIMDEDDKCRYPSELEKTLALFKAEDRLEPSRTSEICVAINDFEKALEFVVPSSTREGFATVPDVSWEDIGALQEIRSELEWSILFPVKRPEDFELLAISAKPQGILLCGPPGCGKTLLAKAVANETGMNFISVKGPELLSMYVGESERAVRTVFQRARDSSPCVIFFDEIDALCPKRSSNENSVGARVVNQLLTEMDGVEARKQVFMIGATNRPDIVDPAILRPGRLDKILFVDFPTAEDRSDILLKLTKNRTRPKIAEDVDFSELAKHPALDHYSGADISALVHEASICALKDRLSKDSTVDCVHLRHFEAATKNVRPSVSEHDRLRYARIKDLYQKGLVATNAQNV